MKMQDHIQYIKEEIKVISTIRNSDSQMKKEIYERKKPEQNKSPVYLKLTCPTLLSQDIFYNDETIMSKKEIKFSRKTKVHTSTNHQIQLL